MRVIQINGSSYVGSTGRIVCQLSEIMNQNGIDNLVISSGYNEQKHYKNVVFVSSRFRVRLHQILGFLFGDSGFHSSLTTIKIIRIIKKYNPDIVHLHHIYGYWLNVNFLLKFLKKNRIKTIWTVHDFWLITGHCAHFESINCNKWKMQCNKCPQIKLYPYSFLFDCSSKLYRIKKNIFSSWQNISFIPVSAWVESFLKQSFLKDKTIHTIHNGIDLSLFKQLNLVRPDYLKKKFIILGVSLTWNEKKGFFDFLSLSSLLLDDEIIMLVGLDDNQIKQLPKNIVGLKKTNSIEELCKIYNLADVYLSMSVEETMGLTVAEAMSVGTPVIVYKETAMEEIVGSETGFVVDKNIDSVRKALTNIKKQGKHFYSDACINRVKENFDKSKQYLKYCEYYKEVLESDENS